MVKRQVLRAATILALKAVTQKDIETREGGKLALLHVLPESDNRGNLHIERRRMHFAVIAFDDVDPV